MLTSGTGAVREANDGVLISSSTGRVIIQSSFWVRPGRVYAFRFQNQFFEVAVSAFVRYSHLLSGSRRQFEIGLEFDDASDSGERLANLQHSIQGTVRLIGRPKHRSDLLQSN